MAETKCKDCPQAARLGRGHCESCAEKARARASRNRAANPERVKAQKRAEYLRNKEKYIARARSWSASNPERRGEIARQWAKSNPAKVRDGRVASKANGRAAQLGVSGTLTLDSRAAIIARWGEKCLACGSAEEITMDHVIPLALGGKNEESNLQPLCLDCNRKKHTQTTDYRVVA